MSKKILVSGDFFMYKLEGCIVLHYVDANGISTASLGDRPTHHATRSVTIVEKPNSVIVHGYNKYLLEQTTRNIGSTLAIISSYIQL